MGKKYKLLKKQYNERYQMYLDKDLEAHSLLQQGKLDVKCINVKNNALEELQAENKRQLAMLKRRVALFFGESINNKETSTPLEVDKLSSRLYSVANYFLNAIDRDAGDVMTNLRLQKLLYYAQAWHLACSGESLFEEDFQAWVHGPAIPELFNQYKGLDLPPNCMHQPLSLETQEILNEIWEVYGQYSTSRLEEIVKSEDPWKDARSGYNSGMACEEVITKESMRGYYSARSKTTEERNLTNYKQLYNKEVEKHNKATSIIARHSREINILKQYIKSIEFREEDFLSSEIDRLEQESDLNIIAMEAKNNEISSLRASLEANLSGYKFLYEREKEKHADATKHVRSYRSDMEVYRKQMRNMNEWRIIGLKHLEKARNELKSKQTRIDALVEERDLANSILLDEMLAYSNHSRSWELAKKELLQERDEAQAKALENYANLLSSEKGFDLAIQSAHEDIDNLTAENKSLKEQVLEVKYPMIEIRGLRNEGLTT